MPPGPPSTLHTPQNQILKKSKGRSGKWDEVKVYSAPVCRYTSDWLLISILMCIYWKC